MSQLHLTNNTCIHQLLHIPARVQQTHRLQPPLWDSSDITFTPAGPQGVSKEVILEAGPNPAFPALPGAQNTGTAPEPVPLLPSVVLTGTGELPLCWDNRRTKTEAAAELKVHSGIWGLLRRHQGWSTTTTTTISSITTTSREHRGGCSPSSAHAGTHVIRRDLGFLGESLPFRASSCISSA